MEVAPVTALALPAAQLVQEDAPLPLYFPTPQVEQVLLEVARVAALALPAAQLVQEDAPLLLYFPAPQSLQDAQPELLLNLPASQ